MNNIPPRDEEEQEIDLAMISQKMRGYSNGFKDFIFDGIQFVVRNIVIIVILLAVGIGLGFYLDRTQKVYDHQLVVAPNFGSTDYLYSKIDLIESKIKERDTVFLEKIGILNPAKLSKIEIKPIIDIYEFINNNNDRNFDLLKLMAEDNDLKKILEERPTSKNYNYHLISFSTKDRTSAQKTVAPLLQYFNDSEYYAKVQREMINNTQVRMKENDQIIAQIDAFLNGVGTGEGKGEKLVYYNENSPLNDVIQTKSNVVKEQGNLRISMVKYDKIVKEISQVLNIENREAINGKMKIVLPLLFIFIFVFIKLFISFYKNQSAKRRQFAQE